MTFSKLWRHKKKFRLKVRDSSGNSRLHSKYQLTKTSPTLYVLCSSVSISVFSKLDWTIGPPTLGPIQRAGMNRWSCYYKPLLTVRGMIYLLNDAVPFPYIQFSFRHQKNCIVYIMRSFSVSSGLGVMVARILKPEPKAITDPVGSQDAEPEFQSPKERECWHLYRRMLEKGVSVSYDTVLR